MGKVWKFFALFFLCTVLLGGGLAYGDGGGQVPETECNDDVDNDNDGDVDGDDSGCHKPYYKDDTEGRNYDFDATKTFADTNNDGDVEANILDTPSPYHAFYASNSKENLSDEKYKEDVVKEGFTNLDSYSANETDTMQLGDNIEERGYVVNQRIFKGKTVYELIDPPAKNTPEKCGNGIENSGEDEGTCPQDYGFAGDTGNSNTKEASNKSITQVLPEYTAPESLRGVSAPSAQVKYNPDIVVKEKESQSDRDIRGRTTDGEIVLEHTSSSGAPDFFLSGVGYSKLRSIKSVYPTSTVKTAGTATNHYFEDKYEDNFTKEDKVYTTCEDTDSDGEDDCPSASSGGCFGQSYSTVADYKLVNDQKSFTIDTKKIEVFGSGGVIGYTTDSLGITFNVIHEDPKLDEQKVAYDCSNDNNDYYNSGSCNSKNCTLKNQEDLYTSSEIGYMDTKSITVTVKWESVSLDQEKIFSADPSSSLSLSGTFSGDHSTKTGLFEGDSYYGSGNVLESGSGFTFDVDTGTGDIGNDPANTYTEFDIGVGGGSYGGSEFTSKVVEELTIDADGPNGQGDGYVAIDEGDIKNGTTGFAAKSWKNGGYDSWLDISGLSISCPGSETRLCLGYVDFYTPEKFDSPRYEYHTSRGNPYALDESLGVTKMFRYLHEDEDTSTGPGGGEYCGDKDGERVVYMEGPEINNDLHDDWKSAFWGCAEEDDMCVDNGETVPEGTVRDIEGPNDESVSFEKGGHNLDKEVCLDIPGEGDFIAEDNVNDDLSEEDAGAEWHDLDSDLVRNHVEMESGELVLKNDNTEIGPNLGYNVAMYYSEATEERRAEGEPKWSSNYDSAMEDDCDPDLSSVYEGCDDSGSRQGGVEGTFFRVGKKGHTGSPDPYTEGAVQDEYNNFTGVHNQIQVYDGGVKSSEGSGTNQANENPQYSPDEWSNSKINSVNDEWGLSDSITDAISLNGSSFTAGEDKKSGGRCYGVQSNSNITKADRVMANSFAAVKSGQGVWIDPDESAKYTDITCDLTQTDFGIGYDDEDSNRRTTYPEGTEVIKELIWDESDPTKVKEPAYSRTVSSKNQFKSMCGDDANEYLLRNKKGSEQELPEGNYQYACADRLSDCVLGGKIYSEGALVDVSEGGTERGVSSNDTEVCLNIKKDKKGGEFYDLDNESIRDYIIYGKDGVGGTPGEPSTYDVPVRLSHPSGVVWHNSSHQGAANQENSGYADASTSVGYALEDDCDPDLKWCDDTGSTTTSDPLFYSTFKEDYQDDDANVTYGVTVQTYIGGSNLTGSNNLQDSENPQVSLTGIDDSRLDFSDDNWAIANRTYDAVGPKGSVYDTGSCYGKTYPSDLNDNDSVTKADKVYANSFALREQVNADSNDEGNWVDPDYTAKSATQGNFTCDLNLTDWGYGYNTSSSASIGTVKGSPTTEGYSGPVSVTGNIQFDKESINGGSNPGVMEQDDLPQFGDACGDDQNEYLIREHDNSSSASKESEFDPDLNDENIFVCADRISDCAYEGEVYSEGQLVDVSSDNPDEEKGVASNDSEVCLNLDESVPGGEWYDVDDADLRSDITGSSASFTEDDVSSYKELTRPHYLYSGDGVQWFTDNYSAAKDYPANESEQSPYNTLSYSDGFALEDDIGPGLQHTDDSGSSETVSEPEYTSFRDGKPADDRQSSGSGYYDALAVRTKVSQDGENYNTSHGSTSGQDEENVPAGMDFTGPTTSVKLSDSTVDPLEDTWALANRTDALVSPTGHVDQDGKCYGPTAFGSPDKVVLKNETKMANSYAASFDGDGDSDPEGVWTDPDALQASAYNGVFSCDLNATDWGYGYDTNKDELYKYSGNYQSEASSVSFGLISVAGDIQFDDDSISGVGDPGAMDQNDLKQYGNACGDDRNEYLIREHEAVSGEFKPKLTRNNIFVCADRISDCAYNGKVYSEGQMIDVSNQDEGEEKGTPSTDMEICLDKNKSIPGGSWYDIDNESVNQLVKGGGTDDTPSGYSLLRRPYNMVSSGEYWMNESYNPKANSQYPASEVEESPFNPLTYSAGYSLEDDVGPGLGLVTDDQNTSMSRFTPPAVYSFFIDEKSADDNHPSGGGWYTGISLRMKVSNDTSDYRVTHGSGTGQMLENTPGTLDYTVTKNGKTVGLNNSRINQLEDTWAITNTTWKVIGPTGKVYMPGQAYGGLAKNQPDNVILKNETVMANSYAARFDSDTDSNEEGVWVDPDSTVNSVKKGGLTADLNATDQGIGFDTGSGLTFYNTDPDLSSEPGTNAVVGNITFDSESDPYGGEQDDLKQYPDACGDDRNEYLLREKSSTSDEDRFVCADRISDCVYNGKIYSEGQLKDISGDADEAGSQSVDEEICLNIDSSVKELGDNSEPGGNWFDIDNEWVSSHLKGSPGTYNPNNTDTYRHFVRENRKDRKNNIRDSVQWYTPDSNSAALEAMISPYNPVKYGAGYSLEDDVGPDVQYSEDSGDSNYKKVPRTVYSFFNDRYEEDDRIRSTYNTDKQDSGTVFTGMSAKLWTGYANGTAYYQHGKTNNQDEENVPSGMNFKDSDTGVQLNDSTVDRKEDTWAIVNSTEKTVGPTGKVYDTGKCYGNMAANQPDNVTLKNETVMANSLAHPVNINGDGDNFKKGTWVNPDSTPATVYNGGITCDLNATDWGIGYDTGNPIQSYRGNAEAPLPDHPDHSGTSPEVGEIAVSGEITFDINSNPGKQDGSNDLMQYPDACGDDQNEYLIREQYERRSDEFVPSLTRDNIYVCADRINDCAFDGNVYSEGQVADISTASTDDEHGDDINDLEVCLNLEESTPGGSWYDMDDSWVKNTTITDNNRWQNLMDFKDSRYWGENPGIDLTVSSSDADYFTKSGYTDKGNIGYHVKGYSTEDDCDWGIDGTPGLDTCDDVGQEEKPKDTGHNVIGLNWFNAGNFSAEGPGGEDAEQDNFHTSSPYDYRGVHNRMQDNSDQFEPGAATEGNWDSIYGPGYNFSDFVDSTPGPDNWSLSSDLTDSVDNFGRSWEAGQCHYRPGPAADIREPAFPETENRTDTMNASVNKTAKVFGNSYAAAMDIGGAGHEGVWIDPDDYRGLAPSADDVATFSCDLTGPDKGFGVDTNAGNADQWEWAETDDKTYVSGNKLVIGDIAFANTQQTSQNIGPWRQEEEVCGDDNKELLLEEQGEAYNPTERTGRWGCGYQQSNCVSRHDGEPAIYEPQDYTDANEPGEREGRLKDDEEICVTRTSPVDDEFGTWYDQDYQESYCRANTLYGPTGVRWFTPSQINEHPNAFKEGIDDDLNDYLISHGHGTFDSNPDTYSGGGGETPVTAGEPESASNPQVATKGFCGGDDASEYLVTQRCKTDLCETDNNIIGTAEDPDKCMLDQDEVSGVSGNNRQIYDEGENVTVTRGGVDNTMACFDSEWYSKWPVVFLRDKAVVEKGTEGRIAFRVINMLGTEKSFDLELRFKNTNTGYKLDEQTVFQSTGTNEMNTTVGAGKSVVHNVAVHGGQNTSMSEVTVYGESSGGSLSGTDSVNVKVTNASLEESFATGQTRDIPGLQGIHLLFILMMASVIYLVSLREFEI